MQHSVPEEITSIRTIEREREREREMITDGTAIY